MRLLIRQRRPSPVPPRELGGPESVGAILDRVVGQLLLNSEIRKTRQ